jgi:hypothetical protein
MTLQCDEKTCAEQFADCRNTQPGHAKSTALHAARLRLLPDEPLTEPLGFMHFAREDAITLVQCASTRHGYAHASPPPLAALHPAARSKNQLGSPPLTAAGVVWAPDVLEPESYTLTALSRLRDDAHARLSRMEAAAVSVASSGRAARAYPRARELAAARVARLEMPRVLECDAGARTSEDHDFCAARLALRRAYAAYKLTASQSVPNSYAANARAVDSSQLTSTQARRGARQRTALRWAMGSSAFGILAYMLTQHVVSQRHGAPSLSAPAVADSRAHTPNVMRQQGGSCVSSEPAVRDVASAAEVVSPQPASASQPANSRQRTPRRQRTRP